MQDERRQFRILYRDFLSRMVDLELISAGGDAQALIAPFGSMLGALSFILAYLMVPRYSSSGWPAAKLAVFARSDEEFLISATITLAGLCAVMAWNTVFPDRRDSLVLGLLPVHARTMIAARIAAIATVLGAAIAALNVFTGLSFPFVLSSGVTDGVRSFVTWWLVMAAAGSFTFCAALAVQGLTAQMLPWRWFLRLSGLLQLALLFVVLAFFFLAPPFDSAKPPAFIPSFWFVGLLHELRGDTTPLFWPLAARATIGLAVVIPLAAVLYALSWSRNLRRIVESPEILPAKRTPVTSAMARLWLPAPFERAIVLFTARTIARSRQHRMMLAIYGGFAFALALGFSQSLLGSNPREVWSRPNAPFLVTGILLLACAVVGTRAIFAFPIAPRANWIFRITSVHRPAAYFAAVRRALYTCGALPVWIAVAICYLAMWTGRAAVEYVVILVVVGIVLVERSLYQFRKIPFACSWLPTGNTVAKMKTGIWCVLFLVLANIIASSELWTVGKPARLILVLGVIGALAIRARFRTNEFAADPDNRVQFEHVPPAEIFALDLRQDGAWSGDEAYVDTIDPNMGRSLALRLRPFAVALLVVMAAGVIYEQAGEWRDRREFPQVGRSVDIGGRSLNIYCSGTGSPAVIFDSGSGLPGYSWVLVQPEVAKMTRACWYDRAGYGWSDPAPGLRASADIAKDLHKLLRAAGVPPPYVMAGHSFGGFNVRAYAALYREEVAGMVLVDSADEFEDTDNAAALEDTGPDLLAYATLRTAQFLFHFGVGRLIVDDPGPPSGLLNGHDSALMQSVEFQEKAFAATFWENRGISAAQVRQIHSPGDIPLVVLTAGGTLPPPGSAMAAAWPEHMRKRVYGTQAQLAKLSTEGRQIILDHVGHDIPENDPEAVVLAVGTVLEQFRNRKP